MKETSEQVIEKIFNEYLETDLAKLSNLDQEQQNTFNDYHDLLESGKADPEDLTKVQYMSLKAGFYAGFRIAIKLIAG